MTTPPPTEALLPCPFCGDEPWAAPGKDGAIIACRSDDCFGPRTTAGNLTDAIVQWNTRAPIRGVAQAGQRRDAALDALEQIWAVCLDNRTYSCDHRMALDFVRQVAGKAVSEAAGKRPIPSVSGNTDREQQRETLGVTAGETAPNSPGPAEAAGEAVALAHITLEDDGPYATLEILNGELLQPSMSPVKLYAKPPHSGQMMGDKA